MMQDEQIIDLYFDRNERALTETTDKYGNYCRTIARNIVYDEETVKECFNDTLLHSWNAMPPTRPNCLKAFVGRITRHVAMKRVTVLTAAKRGGGEAVIALDELQECIPDMTIRSVEQAEEDMAIHDTLRAFLAELPARNRRIFVRRYWYCSSIREIAIAMDLSEANVKTTLSRGRSRLKALLEKAGISV